MARTIQHPYWGNDDKTQVICKFVYDDGVTLEAAVMDTAEGNPDWAEIMNTFSIEEIDAITEVVKQNRGQVSNSVIEQKLAEANLSDEEKAELEARRIEEEKTRVNRIKIEQLFQAKLDAFEIDDVKNSTNRALKSRIRKAKSIVEVQAMTAVLVLNEMIEKGEVNVLELIRPAEDAAE